MPDCFTTAVYSCSRAGVTEAYQLSIEGANAAFSDMNLSAIEPTWPGNGD